MRHVSGEKYKAEHRALRNTKIQGRFCWFVVVYEDILFPVRKVGLKPVQGCTTNARASSELYHKCQSCIWGEREEFHGLLYQKLQKENQNFVIRSEKIVENAEKNSLSAVPGPVSRLMDAEQIVHWQTQGKLLKNKFFRSFERKGRLEMGL